MRKRAAPLSPHEHVVDDEWLDVGVRHAPRVGRFLMLGVAAGIVAAVVFTLAAEASGRGAANFGVEGAARVFALAALVFVAIGLAVTGTIVIVLERTATRRARRSIAGHATVLYHDLSRPTTDDPPSGR